LVYPYQGYFAAIPQRDNRTRTSHLQSHLNPVLSGSLPGKPYGYPGYQVKRFCPKVIFSYLS
jgi:hypothetical protein